MAGWFVLWLVLLDAGIQWAFPVDPLDASRRPSALPVFFAWGRSIERKLRWMVQPTEERSHPVIRAGWLEPGSFSDQPKAADPGRILLAVYGMSFSHHISLHLEELDPRYQTRSIGGPAAPPNFTYAAYEWDRRNHQAKVVVWSLLASTVVDMLGLTGQTTSFDGPEPFTYPRYDFVDGELQVEEPRIRSLLEMRRALEDPTLWDAWIEQLSAHDAFYSDFLFRDDLRDRSVLLRLVRRGWSRRTHRQVQDRVWSAREGFAPDSLPGRTLPELARRFANTARADGRIPLVLLIDNAGYEDHLLRLLGPTLEEHRIPYFSTHEVAPPDDPTQFLPDGHFRPEANARLARELRSILNREIEHHSLQK